MKAALAILLGKNSEPDFRLFAAEVLRPWLKRVVVFDCSCFLTVPLVGFA